jgi:hypothetical protein
VPHRLDASAARRKLAEDSKNDFATPRFVPVALLRALTLSHLLRKVYALKNTADRHVGPKGTVLDLCLPDLREVTSNHERPTSRVPSPSLFNARL